MKPRLLIVFPSLHLAYSPTTLNLYDSLDLAFDVTILAPLPPPGVRRLDNRRVEYVRVPSWITRIADSLNYRLKRYFRWNPQLAAWLLALLLWRAARRHPAAEVIGVDFLGMWVAQRAFGHGHMVSLEIEDEDPFRRRVNLRCIDSLIIQSQARYNHLFHGSGLKYFLVQNAPVFRPSILSSQPAAPVADLLYCGTAVARFGIFRCLDFLARYPQFRLTIQGAVSAAVRQRMTNEYPALLAAGRIHINEQYLEGSELLEYMSRFPIGFCCYDLSMPGMDNFNYQSAPSGKLFAYYAAGVPVIGSDIPGLSSVRDFETGVLIPAFTPEAIHQSVTTILAGHGRLRANCFKAAQHFSFDRAIAPFIESLAARTPLRHCAVRQ